MSRIKLIRSGRLVFMLERFTPITFGSDYWSSFGCRGYARIMHADFSRPISAGNADFATRYNVNYICDIKNLNEIKENISQRKSMADIDRVQKLYNEINAMSSTDTSRSKDLGDLQKEFEREVVLIPNQSCSHLMDYGDTPKLVKMVGQRPHYDFDLKSFEQISRKLHYLLNDRQFSLFSAQKSYFFMGAYADLEHALIREAVKRLIRKGFILLSVPDLLRADIIESCGMQTKGERSQVYHLTNFSDDICLSGTAEMAIAGYLQDKSFPLSELPLKFAAVSRCYRREAGNEREDKGIFRVHEFTKVEMFGVTANETGEESSKLYKDIIDIQTSFYEDLGLHCQVLDMPICELGDAAFTKTDIEACIPGRNPEFGEVSSASNCTDYQARRLNLRYTNSMGEERYCHTVNGTAVAIPRCLMALVTTHQKAAGTINVPEVLQPWMGMDVIAPTKDPVIWARFHSRTYDGKIVTYS